MMNFTLDKTNDFVENILYVPSPNFNERLAGITIDLLVIHGISLPPGEFGGPFIEALFTNSLEPNAHPSFKDLAELRVSAHLLIRRTGEVIQFVPFTKRAWHAGVSEFQGRSNCNDFSIGIELEGTDTQPYEDIQYQQLANLTQVICKAYPTITRKHIVGHCDIAPGRKTDPGPVFDWNYYQQLINKR